MCSGDASVRPGLRRRFARSLLLALAAGALTPVGATPLWAQSFDEAASPAATLGEEIARNADSDLRAFYATRGNRPLWTNANGQISRAGDMLLHQIDTAQLDGLKRKSLKPGKLASALEGAREDGSAEDLAEAEVALSKALVSYVKALRGLPRTPMIYETGALAPVVPTTKSALQAAAAADSIENYVATMGWMHPFYAPLREALADPGYAPEQRQQLASNLMRIRAIPANPSRRYVLVDTATATLWMYEDGQVADTMRVVVGKPDQQTPIMAGFLRYAIVNPYWNVPDDLVRQRIAYNVNTKGLGYLRDGGYQVLSDWSEKATVVEPTKVDWRAVEAGVMTPRVRQLPGPTNFMGGVKFMFPNQQGIYLHDTPDKDLLLKEGRQFSSGCVRLEDAPRFGKWLLGKSLPRKKKEAEQRVELPEVVPIYITYLTAMPQNGQIAFRPDVYARDGLAADSARLASMD
jgi:L,D-transpeptidase YcbB